MEQYQQVIESFLDEPVTFPLVINFFKGKGHLKIFQEVNI